MSAVSCYLGVGGGAANGNNGVTSVYFAFGGAHGSGVNNGYGGGRSAMPGGNIPGSDGVTSAYFGVGGNAAAPTSVYFAVNGAPPQFGGSSQMFANSAYSQDTTADRQQLPDFFKDRVVQVRNPNNGNNVYTARTALVPTQNLSFTDSVGNTIMERNELPDYFKDHVVHVRNPNNGNNIYSVQRPTSRSSSNTNTIMERQQLPDCFKDHIVHVRNPENSFAQYGRNASIMSIQDTIADRQQIPDLFKDHVVQVRNPNTGNNIYPAQRPLACSSSNTNTIMERQQLPDLFKDHIVQVRNPTTSSYAYQQQ